MTNPTPSGRGIVVDDDPDVRKALLRLLRIHGIEAIGAESGEVLAGLLDVMPIDWVLVDIHLPGRDGFEIASHLRERRPKVKVILMTGNHQPGNRALATEVGAGGYITKPIREAEVLAAVLGA